MTQIGPKKPVQPQQQLTVQHADAGTVDSAGQARSAPVVTQSQDDIQRAGVVAEQQTLIGGKDVKFNTEVVPPGQGVGSMLAVLTKQEHRHAVSKAAQQRLQGENIAIKEMKPRDPTRDLRVEYDALHAEADRNDQGILVTDQFRYGDGDVGTYVLMMPKQARSEGGGMWQTEVDGHSFSENTLSSFYDLGSSVVGDGSKLGQEEGLVFATDFTRAAEQMYRGNYAAAQQSLEQVLQQEDVPTSRRVDALNMLALAKTRQGLDGSTELKSAHELSEYDADTVKLLMMNDLERLSRNPPAEESKQLKDRLAARFEEKDFLLSPKDPFVVALKQYLGQ